PPQASRRDPPRSSSGCLRARKARGSSSRTGTERKQAPQPKRRRVAVSARRASRARRTIALRRRSDVPTRPACEGWSSCRRRSVPLGAFAPADSPSDMVPGARPVQLFLRQLFDLVEVGLVGGRYEVGLEAARRARAALHGDGLAVDDDVELLVEGHLL